jgi:hypothetical protein
MEKRHVRWGLAVLLMAGFALRVHQLGRFDFRGDEAFTVQYWMLPTLTAAVQNYITLDPQPPLAYATYNLWGVLAGFSEFAVRMLPALVGTLGIAIAYRFGLRASGQQRVGLLMAFIWALHPFLVWHSQDARNYALWSTASLASMWLALRALERDTVPAWVIFVAVSMATGYLYYLELFVLFALSLYVLVAYGWHWRVYFKWAGAMLTVGAALAPWYLQPQLRSGGYGGTTTGFVPERLFMEFPNTLMFGVTLPPELANWLWPITYAVLALGLWTAYRHSQRVFWLALFAGFVPPVLLSLVATTLNVFAPRYVMGVLPAWVLLLALATVQATRWRPINVLPLVGWAAIAAVSLITYFSAYTKSPNWRALISYLDDTVTPNDLVIQTSTDPSFGYYYHEAYAVHADEQALPAAPNQPTDAIHRELASVSTTYAGVWLAAQGFTDWPSYGVVEAWMADNMQLVIDTDAAGLRAEKYLPWEVRPDELTTNTPRTTFGDVVTLADVRVITPPQPTGELTMWAYWQPLRQTDVPLKAFVHLIGPINPATGTPLWSQHDHEPQNGRAATDTWQPNARYRDVFHLPGAASVPAGDYTLVIGLYNPTTGERLLTADGADSYTIQTIPLP